MSQNTISDQAKSQRYLLNEKQIKCLLIDHLLNTNVDSIIAIEVPFLSGKRWVDVLLITADRNLIVYEIKSDFDSLRKLESQLVDY